MARPKGKLFALLAVFAAIGLVAASGAFTSVSAERTADVNVAGDSSALLSLEENTSASNGDYVDSNGDEITLDISEGANDGGELNLNATTNISSVITVTNQGTQPVDLEVSLSGDNPSLVSVNETGTNNDLTGGSTSATLSQGDQVTLDVVIDTTQDTSLSDGDEIINTITFEANAA